MLKKTILLVVWFAQTYCSYGPLVDELSKPRRALLDLLETQSIRHDGTLSNIVQATQQSWVHYIRPNNLWRLDIPRAIIEEFEEQRGVIVPLLTRLGMIDEALPQQSTYDYIVVFSSFGHEMEERILFLKRLLDEGLAAETIVLLGADRIVDECSDDLDHIRSKYSIKSHVETETDLFIALFLAHLPDFEKSLVVISTPLKDGRFPNTEDQVVEWSKRRPNPGSVLGISNQPYATRQKFALLNNLENSFTIDIAGPAVDEAMPVALLLDTLGRTLYITEQILTSHENVGR